ncbi:MAG: hypothetical protein AB7W59_11110 [Acidimicrobiia bacterium]
MLPLERPAPPRRRWYRAVPPATLQLDCGGARHTVRWKRGRLVLLDHDVGAEAALMALGSDKPACLTLLERWRTMLNGTAGAPGRAAARSVGSVAGGRAGGRVRSAAAAGSDLRSFGADLARVIELSRLVRAERRWADPDLPAADRQRLVDALVGGLRTATAASLRPSAARRGRQQVVVHARPLPSGEEAAAEVTIGPARIEIDLQLPLSWVVEVAGRGLGEQPDRIVLAVIDQLPAEALAGVVGIVWEVDDRGSVAARLERWWTRPAVADGQGWDVVDDAPRPVHPARSLWWSTSRR